MVTFTIASTYILATAIILPTTLAQSSSSDTTPPCLTQCLAQTTQPCTTASLPLLINCINTNCTSQDSTSTDASSAASMSLTYTPKVEYSCQQSFLPGSGSEQAPSMQLTGDGKCMTSPYEFQSLFVSASGSAGMSGDRGDGDGEGDGDLTLQKMARQCSMLLYAGQDCKGDETKLDLSGVQGDKCIFNGGRSAKLLCSVLTVPETQTYTSLISTLCDGTDAPNGTAPSANSTTSPNGAGNGNATTSVIPDPKIPGQTSGVPQPEPYTGRASGDQVAKPSLIALVALFAVAVALL